MTDAKQLTAKTKKKQCSILKTPTGRVDMLPMSFF